MTLFTRDQTPHAPTHCRQDPKYGKSQDAVVKVCTLPVRLVSLHPPACECVVAMHRHATACASCTHMQAYHPDADDLWGLCQDLHRVCLELKDPAARLQRRVCWRVLACTCLPCAGRGRQPRHDLGRDALHPMMHGCSCQDA